MLILMVISVSVLALLAGSLFFSEATTLVGAIAKAGVLAVYGRLMQADKHHKEIKRLMGEADDPP